MDPDTFFREEGIDIYAAVRVTDLPDADRAGALGLVPGARSLFVSGKEVPAEVYSLSPKEKTRQMMRIAESLDRSAKKLATDLNREGHRSEPVPLFLPLRVAGDRVCGIVNLKHAAARGGMGTIGMSTVLISSRFGTRLVLSGVVTELEAGRYGTPLVAGFCGSCGRCARVCPGNAIGPGGVDLFQCRNIRPWVPPPLIPAALWLLRRRCLQCVFAPLASWIIRHATITCSLCVTTCQCFRSGERTVKPVYK